MEEKPFKALAKSSVKSNPHSDIRNLWTTATLSQPKINVQLSNVYRDSELESSSVGSKTSEWYNRKNASHDSDGGWEESDDRDDNVSFKQEELDDHTLLELHPGSSFGSRLEEEDDSSTEMGRQHLELFSEGHSPCQMPPHTFFLLQGRSSSLQITLFSLLPEITSSMPSFSILKHTPHRAYWVEQQTRVGGTQGDGILVGWGMGKLEVAGGLWVERQEGWLGVLGLEAAGGPFQLWAELGSLGHLCLLLPLQLPLPLMELMENEALEILTKALRSYRSEIGGNHFLTKQLQRYIEGLKRRRNKRLNISVC
ncbi:cation channel sperm-associated auxiliary subunit zeta isoform X2 [Rhinolophus sinicus]|uniref:cation channel sperm-associated auxiliary subunit zeta isoform X2 n=1 Tax=Rhinolophus sinicus TaxID=89399 RepID=UPI003D7978E6